MPKFKKGSKEAKAFMAKLRAKKNKKAAPKKSIGAAKKVARKKVGATLIIESNENKRTKPKRVIKRERAGTGTFKSFKSIGNADIKTTKGKKNLQNVKSFISIVSSLGNLKTDGTKRGLKMWVDNSLAAEQILKKIDKSILPHLYLSNLNDAIKAFNYWKVK